MAKVRRTLAWSENILAILVYVAVLGALALIVYCAFVGLWKGVAAFSFYLATALVGYYLAWNKRQDSRQRNQLKG